MIVQCPYCATRYELDAARIAGPNPMLKCSRCRHIFPAPSDTKRAPAPAAAPTRARAHPPAEENLQLPFDEPHWKEPPDAPPPTDLTVPEADDRFTLGTEEPPDELVMPEMQPEPDVTPSTARAGIADEDEQEAMAIDLQRDGEELEPAERPVRSRRERTPREAEPTHIVPVFVFLTLVVAGYGVLTSALFTNPALSDKLVGRLPLIGTLGDERLLVRKVALSDVAGSYQRIKDGKEVFVITGKALNTAAVALQGVQIAGKLYDNAGGPLDQKVISCGNVISTKVLKDLTPQEVSILQKLSPPKKFVIESGESSTFVIVFMDPPRQAVEFTTQVVAAQRQA